MDDERSRPRVWVWDWRPIAVTLASLVVLVSIAVSLAWFFNPSRGNLVSGTAIANANEQQATTRSRNIDNADHYERQLGLPESARAKSDKLGIEGSREDLYRYKRAPPCSAQPKRCSVPKPTRTRVYSIHSQSSSGSCYADSLPSTSCTDTISSISTDYHLQTKTRSRKAGKRHYPTRISTPDSSSFTSKAAESSVESLDRGSTCDYSFITANTSFWNNLIDERMRREAAMDDTTDAASSVVETEQTMPDDRAQAPALKPVQSDTYPRPQQLDRAQDIYPPPHQLDRSQDIYPPPQQLDRSQDSALKPVESDIHPSPKQDRRPPPQKYHHHEHNHTHHHYHLICDTHAKKSSKYRKGNKIDIIVPAAVTGVENLGSRGQFNRTGSDQRIDLDDTRNVGDHSKDSAGPPSEPASERISCEDEAGTEPENMNLPDGRDPAPSEFHRYIAKLEDALELFFEHRRVVDVEVPASICEWLLTDEENRHLMELTYLKESIPIEELLDSTQNFYEELLYSPDLTRAIPVHVALPNVTPSRELIKERHEQAVVKRSLGVYEAMMIHDHGSRLDGIVQNLTRTGVTQRPSLHEEHNLQMVPEEDKAVLSNTARLIMGMNAYLTAMHKRVVLGESYGDELAKNARKFAMERKWIEPFYLADAYVLNHLLGVLFKALHTPGILSEWESELHRTLSSHNHQNVLDAFPLPHKKVLNLIHEIRCGERPVVKKDTLFVEVFDNILQAITNDQMNVMSCIDSALQDPGATYLAREDSADYICQELISIQRAAICEQMELFIPEWIDDGLHRWLQLADQAYLDDIQRLNEQLEQKNAEKCKTDRVNEAIMIARKRHAKHTCQELIKIQEAALICDKEETLSIPNWIHHGLDRGLQYADQQDLDKIHTLNKKLKQRYPDEIRQLKKQIKKSKKPGVFRRIFGFLAP